MKYIVLVVLCLSFVGCCSVKESTTTTTITSDSTIHPTPVHDSIFVQDESFMEWYNLEISALRAEIDRLQGLEMGKDTTIIKYLPRKPFVHQWEAYKVTQNGDSVWVTFRYNNGDGTFLFRIVPTKIAVQVNSTTVENVMKDHVPWYTAAWREAKDYLLYWVVAALIVAALLRRLGVF